MQEAVATFRFPDVRKAAVAREAFRRRFTAPDKDFLTAPRDAC
jgi:hypothetical protein